MSASRGSISAATGQGLAEIGSAEHDDDAANNARNNPQRRPAEHEQKPDADNPEHGHRLTKRPQDEGADDY